MVAVGLPSRHSGTGPLTQEQLNDCATEEIAPAFLRLPARLHARTFHNEHAFRWRIRGYQAGQESMPCAAYEIITGLVGKGMTLSLPRDDAFSSLNGKQALAAL